MAIPLGKLTILVGAGILGSVLAKEGRMPDVSSFVSGAFKIALRQLKRDDSTSSVSKSSKPPNDSLMAQVTSLRQELQMLASSRPVTIVTASGTGLGSDPSLASETGDELCCVHPVLTTHLWTGLVNVELLPILLLEKLLKA